MKDIEKKLIDIMEQKQSFGEGNYIADKGIQQIKKQLNNINREVNEYSDKETKYKEKLDKLKEQKNKLNDIKNKLDNEYEKSMTQISKTDKNFSKQETDDIEEDDNIAETKGAETKIGDTDLNRVLNFYGDMDKPNNERKINNQEINKNQRDW